jgi:hypothetical protein
VIELSSLVAGAVLLLLLMGLAIKGWLAARHLQDPAIETGAADLSQPCPEIFVTRVFSRADWDYVQRLEADGIRNLFQRERKKLALLWVRQTSLMIRKAMREHAGAARQSSNLEFSTEIRIFGQFVMLMLVCGILSVAIQIAGPLSLSGLARFAQRLSQRVAKVQESFEPGPLAKAAGRTA